MPKGLESGSAEVLLQPALRRAAKIAALLGEPLRLAVLQVLAVEGPQSSGRLAEGLGVSPSRLTNHLLSLRDAGLVVNERDGRVVTYRLDDARLPALLNALSSFADLNEVDLAHEHACRTCYDHLAGPVGVKIWDELSDAGVLTVQSDGTVAVDASKTSPLLTTLKIDLRHRHADSANARPCLDRSARKAHTAGPLGALIRHRLVDRGYVKITDGMRDVTITSRGKRVLAAQPTSSEH